MTKNLIPEVCKLLGVEVGEEFKICVEGVKQAGEFYIDKNGLLCEAPQREEYELAYGLELEDLLNGYAEIVKLPWKPKNDEKFYTVTFTCKDDKLHVSQERIWADGYLPYLALFKAGWVYRTQEEAEAALPKVAKEIGVEYEL